MQEHFIYKVKIPEEAKPLLEELISEILCVNEGFDSPTNPYLYIGADMARGLQIFGNQAGRWGARNTQDVTYNKFRWNEEKKDYETYDVHETQGLPYCYACRADIRNWPEIIIEE